MTQPDRSEALLLLFVGGLAAGAFAMGGGSGLAVFTALPCALFGGALVAWRRDPSPSMAALVLLSGGFVRILLGPIGMAALLMVPLVATGPREQRRPLVAAAVGVHLAVFAANQLAVALGEPFPTLATFSPGEAIAGLALFVPFALLGDPTPAVGRSGGQADS